METLGYGTNLTFHCHVINQYRLAIRTSMMNLGLDSDRFWMTPYSLEIKRSSSLFNIPSSMVTMVCPSVTQTYLRGGCYSTPPPELRHFLPPLLRASTGCWEFSAETLSRHCLCLKTVTSPAVLPPPLSHPTFSDGSYGDVKLWSFCLSLGHSRAISAPQHPTGSAEGFVGTTSKFNFTLSPVPLPSSSRLLIPRALPITLLPRSSVWEFVPEEPDLPQLLNKRSQQVGSECFPPSAARGPWWPVLCLPLMHAIYIQHSDLARTFSRVNIIMKITSVKGCHWRTSL